MGTKLAVVVAGAALLALLAAACGGDGEEAVETPPADGATATAAPTEPADADTPPPLTPGTGEGPEPTGKVAFYAFRDGDQEIYVMNPDGSDQRNLTNNPAQDFEPDWSPDGKQIAFVSDRDGSAHLYVMNGDGSDVRRLTEGSGGYLSPRWSPDGQLIAFSRSGTPMVMEADGSNIRTVMEPEPESTASPCKAPGFIGGWSPDSTHITYYSASVTRGIGEVCTIALDGSDLQVVVSEPPGLHTEPVWSNDGGYLAYRSIRAENHDVYVIDLETGEERRLTDGPRVDAEPEWSPDDEWIAFVSYRDYPNSDIYIMRKDGSDVRRLTTDPAKDTYPIWAP